MPIRTTTLSRMRQMMTSALNEANLLEYLLRLSSCSSSSTGASASASADSPTSATGSLDSRGARPATRRAPLQPVGCVYQLLSARSGSGVGVSATGTGSGGSSSSALVSRASSSAMTPTTPAAAAARCESPFEDPFGFVRTRDDDDFDELSFSGPLRGLYLYTDADPSARLAPALYARRFARAARPTAACAHRGLHAALSLSSARRRRRLEQCHSTKGILGSLQPIRYQLIINGA